MAGKRKKKTRVQQESLAMPSRWRLQHGGFSEPIREADPETGVPVVHRRAVDTLGQMLANGTITQEMHDAGAVFRRQFRVAALDGLAGASLVRLPARRRDHDRAAGPARRQVAMRWTCWAAPAGRGCCVCTWSPRCSVRGGPCDGGGAEGPCLRARRRGCWSPPFRSLLATTGFRHLLWHPGSEKPR